MPEFVILMRSDVENRAKADDGPAWGEYMSKLRRSGALQGGSSIGRGLAFRKGSSPQQAELSIEGYIKVQAASLEDAQRFVEGNPNYEAGGTIEIRVLPSEP